MVHQFFSLVLGLRGAFKTQPTGQSTVEGLEKEQLACLLKIVTKFPRRRLGCDKKYRVKVSKVSVLQWHCIFTDSVRECRCVEIPAFPFNGVAAWKYQVGPRVGVVSWKRPALGPECLPCGVVSWKSVPCRKSFAADAARIARCRCEKNRCIPVAILV